MWVVRDDVLGKNVGREALKILDLVKLAEQFYHLFSFTVNKVQD